MTASLLEADVNTGGYERDEVIMNSAGVVYSGNVLQFVSDASLRPDLVIQRQPTP
jgi:hypothetical protein